MKLNDEKQTFIGVILAILIALFIIALALSAQGCGKTENQPPAVSNSPAQNPPAPIPSEIDGKSVYEKNCVVCHGPEGKGDGVASGGQARNFTKKSEWKTYGDDEKTYKVIAEGGPAVLGPLSGMPPFGNSLSKEEIKAVVNYVKSLAK